MSEHLPYENELLKKLQDLPLPGEDMAWADMRRRLEDDDDKPVVPPLAKGCTRYALLLIVLVAAAFLLADPFKWIHSKTNAETTQNSTDRKDGELIGDSLALTKATQNKKEGTRDSFSSKKTNAANPVIAEAISKDSTNIIAGHPKDDTIKQQDKATESAKKAAAGYRFKNQIPSGNLSGNKRKNYMARKNGNAMIAINRATASGPIQPNKNLKRKTKGKLTTTISGDPVDSLKLEPAPVVPKNDNQSTITINDTAHLQPVPVQKASIDSFKKITPDTSVASKKEKLDSSEKKKIYFSAGLALHQLLPIAGQKTSPYSSTGRKGSLADYIPSIYLRIHRDKKWFIQSEFRYGAPQYNKELVFNDRVIDTGSITVSASRSSVKKTFYNQLPFSFNYFILPDLSIGAGFTFNKFKAALVQRDIHITNLVTQKDTVLSTELVSQKGADSNFVTTYFQGLVEMQYQWKRFSLGARYSFGLQPYLKFKLPGGQESKERNTALQLFIRYELWRSKK